LRELRDRVVAEVGKVGGGTGSRRRRAARRDHGRRPRAARGRTRRGQDPARPTPSPARSVSTSAGCSSPPDMLPSDLTGTMTLRSTASGADLVFRPGPVFANLVLADEINRTPPKTQSALLEAMQERQVSVDGVAHPLPSPFLLVADAEPDRIRRHLSASRGPARPIPRQGRRRLPEARPDEIAMLRMTHTRGRAGNATDVAAGSERGRSLARRGQPSSTR